MAEFIQITSSFKEDWWLKRDEKRLLLRLIQLNVNKQKQYQCIEAPFMDRALMYRAEN